MAFVGLVPSEHSSGAAHARSDHEGRQQPRPSPAGRVGLARAPPPEGRLRAPAATAARTRRDRARLALPAAPPPALAADGRPRQAAPEDRRRLRPRARRFRLGDRHRPTTQKQPDINYSRPEQRMRPPHGEPSQASMRHRRRRPATLDRGSSRRFPVMRSRPANVSLIHRRCPHPPLTRTHHNP